MIQITNDGHLPQIERFTVYGLLVRHLPRVVVEVHRVYTKPSITALEVRYANEGNRRCM